VPHRTIWTWYTGRWCYIWYSEVGTVLFYGPLLCGFNLSIKLSVVAQLRAMTVLKLAVKKTEWFYWEHVFQIAKTAHNFKSQITILYNFQKFFWGKQDPCDASVLLDFQSASSPRKEAGSAWEGSVGWPVIVCRHHTGLVSLKKKLKNYIKWLFEIYNCVQFWQFERQVLNKIIQLRCNALRDGDVPFDLKVTEGRRSTAHWQLTACSTEWWSYRTTSTASSGQTDTSDTPSFRRSCTVMPTSPRPDSSTRPSVFPTCCISSTARSTPLHSDSSLSLHLTNRSNSLIVLYSFFTSVQMSP